MEAVAANGATRARPKRLDPFERWLSLWVALCMVAGVGLGKLLPGLVDHLRRLEFGEESQINVPIAVLLWLMIYPMMLRIDLGSILGVRRRPRGILVTLLVSGASDLTVPFEVLLHGVGIFIVVPLVLGSLSRSLLLRVKDEWWFDARFLPFFKPVTILALLATLVLIFAFQAENLTSRFVHVVLIAIPILIRVYFNSGLVYGLLKLVRVPHNVAAPGRNVSTILRDPVVEFDVDPPLSMSV